MNRNTRWGMAAATAVLVLVAAVFAALSLFVYPSSLDDYVAASMAVQKGFWASQAFWYTHWIGRYTATALATLYGMAITRHVDSLISLSALALSYWAGYRLLRRLLDASADWRTIGLATLGLLLWRLLSMPSVRDAFYWTTGVLTYTVADIAMLWLFSVLLGKGRGGMDGTNQAWRAAWGVALTLFIAGLSEVYLLILGPLVVLGAWREAWVSRKMPVAWLAVLAAAVAGFLLVYASPGNHARQAAEEVSRQIGPSVAYALRHVWWKVQWWTIGSPSAGAGARGWTALSVVVVGLIVFLFSAGRVNSPWRRGGTAAALAMTPLVGLCLMFGILFAHYWAKNAEAPPRVLNLVHHVFLSTLVATAALAGVLAGQWSGARAWASAWSPRILTPLTLVFLALLPAAPVFRVALADLLYRAHPYAEEMRCRARLIETARSNGLLDLAVPELRHRPKLLFVDDIKSNPEAGENRAYATSWGLRSIRTVPAYPDR